MRRQALVPLRALLLDAPPEVAKQVLWKRHLWHMHALRKDAKQ